MSDAWLPQEAEVVDCITETPDIRTLRLRFTDPERQRAYRFAPGQFNMLALHGIGEVPISIVSDVEDVHLFDHTIRAVGRVTRALARLECGARLGVRGPFGRGWPLEAAEGRDLVVLTGGLGCAPAVSVIRHVLRRRGSFGRLTIMQGVKHANDLLWREQYEAWAREPDTQVLLAADVATPDWPWHQGLVTELFDRIGGSLVGAVAMMCGPEPMMMAAGRKLLDYGLAASDIYLSMERNMHCGAGKCGHCQLGPHFVCRDGPVFSWAALAPCIGIQGY